MVTTLPCKILIMNLAYTHVCTLFTTIHHIIVAVAVCQHRDWWQ